MPNSTYSRKNDRFENIVLNKNERRPIIGTSIVIPQIEVVNRRYLFTKEHMH